VLAAREDVADGAQPNGKSQIADCEIAESELQIPHPHPQELRLGSG